MRDEIETSNAVCE